MHTETCSPATNPHDWFDFEVAVPNGTYTVKAEVGESHTHLPAKDYPGPRDDRIKVYEDTIDDGRADRYHSHSDSGVVLF